MKKKYIILSLVLMLSACSTTVQKDEQPKNSTQSYCTEDNDTSCSIDDSADMADYEGFDDKNNAFVEINMEKALSVFRNKETAILYFGYPQCPWCVEVVPILDEIAKESNEQIFYIRTRDDKKELLYSEDQKKEFVSYAGEHLEKDEDDVYQLYVPFVVIVKNGKIVSSHIGTVEGHDAHERKMTTSEINELTKLYKGMFQQIK